MKLPSFFIVGSPKCGTTSLYKYLDNHVHICMSEVKEPNYFSREELEENFLYYKDTNNIKKIDDYINLFNSCNENSIWGEASVSYLYYSNTAKKIFNFNKKSKIIIVLRNPIDRAYSHYLMDYTSGYFNYTFEEVVDNKFKLIDTNVYQQVVGLGFYSQQVARYLDIFDKSNVLIIFQEELSRDTKGTVKHVFDFLGVDNSEKFLEVTNRRLHAYKKPNSVIFEWLYRNVKLKSYLRKVVSKKVKDRLKDSFLTETNKPKMSSLSRTKLVNFYKQDVMELSNLVNKDLSLLWRDFNE